MLAEDPNICTIDVLVKCIFISLCKYLLSPGVMGINKHLILRVQSIWILDGQLDVSKTKTLSLGPWYEQLQRLTLLIDQYFALSDKLK